MDSAGNVYVADTGNNTIRKITPAGVVSTLAGLAGSHGSADGTGSAARFIIPPAWRWTAPGMFMWRTPQQHHPQDHSRWRGEHPGRFGRLWQHRWQERRLFGVAVDSAGNVYVADTDNHTIRKITPAGVVSTLAGLAGSLGSADGTGSAARFYHPGGVAVDSGGNVYVADTDNHTIRKITPAGVVSTLAGLAGNLAAPMAPAAPRGLIIPTAWRWTAPAMSMWRIPTTTPSARSRPLAW